MKDLIIKAFYIAMVSAVAIMLEAPAVMLCMVMLFVLEVW
jgi:hypothetical protein